MIVDRALVRRIEASACRVMAATVEGFIGNGPADPARSAPFSSGVLVAFGPGRHVNRAVGVTVDDIDDDALDDLESWYRHAGLAPSLEVTSWAPATLVDRLARRGYVTSWFRNVYGHSLDATTSTPDLPVTLREVTPDVVPAWLAVLREGSDATTPAAARVSDEMAQAGHAVAGTTAFLAEVDGTVAGCGSVTCDGSTAWLGGAATIPSSRRLGVQRALVLHRLAVAEAAGCDLAVATAAPSGDSARNLFRLGFTLVHCQAVMSKAPGNTST